MAKKANTKDNPYFVGIHDPIEIRRTILESSKETIHLMQQFERFKSIRDEKKALVEVLRTDLKNIQVLINKLKKLVPKTKLRIALHGDLQKLTDEKKAAKKKAKAAKKVTKKTTKKVTKKAPAKKKVTKKKPSVKKKLKIPELEVPEQEEVKKPKKLSDIEKLEKELNAIEGKLGGI